MTPMVQFGMIIFLIGAIITACIYLIVAAIDVAMRSSLKNIACRDWQINLRYLAWSFFLWPHFLYSFHHEKTIYHQK